MDALLQRGAPPAPHEVAKTEKDTTHAGNDQQQNPHAKEHRRVL